MSRRAFPTFTTQLPRAPHDSKRPKVGPHPRRRRKTLSPWNDTSIGSSLNLQKIRAQRQGEFHTQWRLEMGYARVFWMYEDDLRHMRGDDDARLIGHRVLELFERGGSGYDHVDLPLSSPGICQAGQFHSTQPATLAWKANALVRVKDPTPDQRAANGSSTGSAPSDDASAAAARYWQMLTARVDDVTPFGQRLLFHLPRSPICLLYTSPSPRDGLLSRMPSSA